jgi:mannose-6-phosphate isomerase class I
MEEKLQVIYDTVFRYGIVTERSFDAHQLMNIGMKNKVEAYESRIKDTEEKYVHTITQLDRFQALTWDVEN